MSIKPTFTIKDIDTETKLKYKSEVRTNEIFTVHKSLIIKKLTSFKRESLRQLTEKVKENISVK